MFFQKDHIRCLLYASNHLVTHYYTRLPVYHPIPSRIPQHHFTSQQHSINLHRYMTTIIHPPLRILQINPLIPFVPPYGRVSLVT